MEQKKHFKLYKSGKNIPIEIRGKTMLSSLLKSQAIQLTKNDKFSKIIEQIMSDYYKKSRRDN